MVNRRTRTGLWLVSAALVAIGGCNAILGNETGELVGSAASTGSTSGGGCATAADCGPGTECRVPRCEQSACTFDLTPSGGVTGNQTAGDCKVVECDGKGNLISVDDEEDVFDDGNDCTDDVCKSGLAENEPKAAGSRCVIGGNVCDGKGACIECIDQADCGATEICQQAQCVPTACGDIAKGENETDVDCGGIDCAPCADGKTCVAGTDCSSSICDTNVCKAADCTDGFANGTETDTDCGGDCPEKCAPGKGCSGNDDCTGNLCTGTTCAPTCSDLEKNGQETDVDCGGPVCGDCEDGLACGDATDCASGLCAGSVCQPAHCANGSKDGGESGTDCGGTCDATCAFGGGCSKNADCTSNLCITGHCA